MSWIGWVVIGILGLIALNVVAFVLMYFNFLIEEREKRRRWK